MPSWKEKVLYIALTLTVLGLIVLYVFEFYYFQRTFEIKKLLLIPAMLGVVAGVVLGWRLGRDAEDYVERIQAYLICVVLTTVFLPLLASLSNRLLGGPSVRWEGVAFFEEKPYVSDRFGLMKGEQVKPRGYYLFFLRNGELTRIDNRHRLSPPPIRGDTILIPVRKGLWGIEWVESDRDPWAAEE